MTGLLLLVTVTTFYAGYNLLIKVSASHVPVAATSTIAATVVIPAVVSGTIVISVIAAYFIFSETLALIQLAGLGCIIIGILLLHFGKDLALG